MQTLSKTERVKKFGEVFTPAWCVRDMCDMLEAENAGRDVFAPETTFLEPACGDGAFVAEILRRKFDRCKRRRDYTVALESVYGFEIQADNVEKCIQNLTILCCQYFKPTKAEEQIISDHIIQCDGLKVMRMLAKMEGDHSGG
jgi:hypothetical protein